MREDETTKQGAVAVAVDAQTVVASTEVSFVPTINMTEKKREFEQTQRHKRNRESFKICIIYMLFYYFIELRKYYSLFLYLLTVCLKENR